MSEFITCPSGCFKMRSMTSILVIHATTTISSQPAVGTQSFDDHDHDLQRSIP